ncbi:uncharacterized protein zgc:193711 [Osmerus mordax]|uniref:uncharacterized protein zgc:193711 n=1 Tax=Osmerus mordax TaxID=8014 RepID=UPI0035102167
MGNGLNKTLDRWGANPRKLNKKRKGDPVEPQEQVPDVHIYDDVPDEGQRQRQDSDGILYADLQLRPHPAASGGRTFPRPSDEQHTEYASVNFTPRGEKLNQKLTSLQRQFSPSPVKPSSLPADILIPPGALKTPKRQQQPSPSSPRPTHTTQHKPVVV